MLIQEPPTPTFPVRSLALALFLVPLSGCPTPRDAPADDGAESGSSGSSDVMTGGADADNNADVGDGTTGGPSNAETDTGGPTGGDAMDDT
ncbi:MAG: hypothetical protein JKY37_14160, partial [Nannocystaceae bacterium]|nr:hypothetical protein [Nannocystaceae bacterium]